MTFFFKPPDGGVKAARKINEALRGVSASGEWARMFDEEEESRGDAPAPPKDRVKGSNVNDEGSAKNKSGDISLSDATVAALKAKAEEHNAAMRERKRPDWTQVRLGSLKAVWRRGAGAFSTSHRPGMTRDRWAMARVNAFLALARRGRPENPKYVSDFDLLHAKHPKHSDERRADDCGRDENGRFTSGNKCGTPSDSPKEDPRGRLRYDDGTQTDAARKLYQMGSSEKKLRGLVDAMGGVPSNTRVDINPPSVNISVANASGQKLFHVDLDNNRARVYPMRDLGGDAVAKIRDAAKEAFPVGNESGFKLTVFRKAADFKKWEAENDAKLKAWEDKYKFSTLLPPHQRPKKWENRDADCTRNSDGTFGSGNKCQEEGGGATSNDVDGVSVSLMPTPPAANYIQLATGELSDADYLQGMFRGGYASDIEHFRYQSAVARQVGKAGVDLEVDTHTRDGRRTVDSVRAVSVGVQFAIDAGLKLPERVLIGDTSRYVGSSAFACFVHEPYAPVPTIAIDRALSADEVSDRILANWLAGDPSKPLETLFAHELSHLEHYDSLPPAAQARWEKWTGLPQYLEAKRDAELNGRIFRPSAGTLEGLAWDRSLRVSDLSMLSGAQAMDVARKHVSGYAAKNPLEFVAEFRTGVLMGKSYPDEAWSLYDDYGGPKIPKAKNK